jgi:hypothetical protein
VPLLGGAAGVDVGGAADAATDLCDGFDELHADATRSTPTTAAPVLQVWFTRGHPPGQRT